MRRGVLRAGWGIALILVVVVLLLAGAALCLWAIYLYLATALAQPAAALITGVITLAVAGLIAWNVARIGR